MTVRRLWLRNRSFVAVRMLLTAPARVTGVFVAPDGSSVPGQTIKTPTRHAGVTILRVPLRSRSPGSTGCRCTPRARARSSTARRRSTSCATQPASPIWQDGALRVAIVRGARGSRLARRPARQALRRSPDRRREPLRRRSTRATRTAAAVVVVDLGTVPTYTLAELHALLPGGADRRPDRDAGQGRVLPAASA